jgi:glycosyltransferase involved in cell wall biosynthesis
MRVLFVSPPSSVPSDGGSFTFIKSVTEAIGKTQTNHSFRLFGARTDGVALQTIVAADQIDFVWFLAPYYEHVLVPFAITVWDLGHRTLPFFPEVSLSGWKFENRESLYATVLPRAAIIVTGNEAGRDQISNFYRIPSERIVLNPLPLSPDLRNTMGSDEVLKKFGLTPASYLLYPAQFWPHKNHITVLDALKRLLDDGEDLRVVFTGRDKGNQVHVAQYAAAHLPPDRVIFAGFVTVEELVGLYKNAFAMIFASLLGPDNLPPIEAMSFGCPVVCARYDGALQQLSGGALLFDALDSTEAAAKVKSLRDLEARELLVREGHLVADKFSTRSYGMTILRALDGFASIRKLWAGGSGYEHL